MSSVLDVISPAWILVILIGAFWAGLGAVIVPPKAEHFPKILVVTIVGAAAGQIISLALHRQLIAVGDAHVAGASAGALLALAIVRVTSA